MATEAFMRHGILLVILAVSQIKASGVILDLLRVEGDVEHRYAVTQVTAAYVNLQNTSQEISLKMTLPKDAYVSSLVIDVGGKNHSTVVAEKERVRRTGPKNPPGKNDRHRKRGGNTQKFRASAKIRGLQTAIFYLTYEQLLVRRQGSYTYDLHLGIAKRIENLEVKLRFFETEEIKEFQILRLPWASSMTSSENTSEVEEVMESPGEITASYSWENITILNAINETTAADEDDEEFGIGNNPSTLSVSYDVDRATDGGEIQILGQFFVHRFSPEGLPKLPTHTVFVLDVSGSMHDNGKLTQLKVAMRAILTNLPPEDSFEILVFSTRVTSLGKFKADPEDVERSLSRVQRLQALGGTNFNEAFLRALQDVNNFNLTSGAKQVVFLTDGRPNLGEKKPSQLRRNVREANIHHLPIHSLGFGHDADMRLLRQVSTDNQGFTGKIDEDIRPAEQLKCFYDKISSPLMTDIEIMYMDNEVDTSSVVRQGPSTFYAGDEMVLAGQLKEGVKEVQPLVSGQGNDGPLQFRVSRVSTPEKVIVRDNYVERLWAYLTVKDLLEMQEVVEDRNLKAEMNFRALEIALKFQFVTKLTSLKPEEEVEDDGEEQEGLTHKSASRYQKSNTGSVTLFYDHLALLSEAEFAKTLPAPLSTRLNTASNNRFSFGDNDPHFVVQVSGMDMPFCFDIHGQHGQVLSLVRDENSGIVVNGLVTSAVGRPEATYFTKLFMGLGKVNFTITPHNITITFLQGHKHSKIPRVLRSVWPFRKMYKRGKKGHKGKKKSRHQGRKQTTRSRRDLAASRTEDSIAALSSRTKEVKQFRDSVRYQKQKANPRHNILRHGIMNDYNYSNHKRRGSIVMRNLDSTNYGQTQASHMIELKINKIPKVGKKVKKRRRKRIASEVHRNSIIPVLYSRNYLNMISSDSKTVRPTTVNHRRPAYTPSQLQIITAYPNNKASQVKRRCQRNRWIKKRSKRNAYFRKLVDIIHPQSRKNEDHRITHRNRYSFLRHKLHPHFHAFHKLVPTSDESYSEDHPRDTYLPKRPVSPLAAASSLFRTEMEEQQSETIMTTPKSSGMFLKPVTSTTLSRLVDHIQNTSKTSSIENTIFTTTDKSTESVGVSQTTSLYQETITQDPRNTAARERIIHPHERRNLSVFNLHQVFRHTDKELSTFLHQPKEQNLTRKAESTVDDPNLFRSVIEYVHPQSRVFSLTTVIPALEINSAFIRNDSETKSPSSKVAEPEMDERPGLAEQSGTIHPSEEKRQKRRPEKTFSWRRAAGRRYGDVVVALKNRKKLEVLIGDVDIHFVVIRSKTKYGQEFLGFYVEEHNILSPNTTGIIGQFAYKTVSTFSPADERLKEEISQTAMKVAVLHQGANMQYRVSEVSGMVSKRRSMLHKNHVQCLLVPNQGEGLVAGTPEDYFLPCLTC